MTVNGADAGTPPDNLCRLAVSLDYSYSTDTDVLIQIEAASLPGQTVLDSQFSIAGDHSIARSAAYGGIGTRRWLRLQGALTVRYDALVKLDRAPATISHLGATPPHGLPAEACDYLMPSRYCQSDLLHDQVADNFAGLSGGALIAAMRDWVASTLTYAPGASHAGTSALETLNSRNGVCRDYTHLLVALARAAWIPARYVSVCAPGVSPQDFHAVAEVFLDGRWHLVDPTGMATAADMVIIGVGRDAADVPFLSSFGEAWFIAQQVQVTRISSPVPVAG